MYKLTKEGRKYLSSGLPEKNLIAALQAGGKNISDIDIEGKEIAIAWAKRNGWISIEKNFLDLTDEGRKAIGKKTNVETALEQIEKTGKCDENLLKILASRKLVEEIRERKEIKAAPKISGVTEIAQLTPDLIKTGRWRSLPFRKYDVNAPAPLVFPGKKQPYVQFIGEVKEKLIAMGFVEAKSPLVETEFWNFDVLFQAQDHPAREIHDTFNLKNPKIGKIEDKNLVEKVKRIHENGWITGSKGWQYKWEFEKALKLVLRTQTTPASARFLYSLPEEQKAEPVKMFCIGRVFRPDVLDKTHLIEFDQCEGIIMGENLTMRHLLGMLKEFAKTVIGTEKVRFIPSYFPFTEPSVEMYVYFEKWKKWIEVVGAGLFRKEMVAPLGIDKPVLAWGFGFSRLAMLKLEIDDIRYLFAEDLGWLRETPLIR